MVDLPDTMVDLPNNMVDFPETLVDLPNTMVDLPNTMVDLPNTMVDLFYPKYYWIYPKCDWIFPNMAGWATLYLPLSSKWVRHNQVSWSSFFACLCWLAPTLLAKTFVNCEAILNEIVLASTNLFNLNCKIKCFHIKKKRSIILV